MATTSLMYRALLAAAVPLVPVALRDPRQRAAHAGRVSAAARLEEWARTRDRAAPLVWFHAPSVGEGLQAQAVMDAVRMTRPDAVLIYTHYSPSAEDFAGTVPAEWTGYLPYDRAHDVQRALDAVDPDVLVFTKLDLWPELAVRAAARGTRVVMVAATVSPESGRLRWPARALTAPGYASLHAVGAVSAEDADRLARLGCVPDRITITGDPRIDSALARIAQFPPNASIKALGDPDTTFIAGSTWPEDEAVVLEAFAEVHRADPRARLILAPHDPSPARLVAVESLASRLGLPAPVHLANIDPQRAEPFVLVDRVGVLAQLYAAAGMAYIGGGWGSKGIHSVLEPAAYGLPVLIGPYDRESRDAALLAGAGGLTRLPLRDAAAAMAAQWSAWLRSPDERRAAGFAAREAMERERGAADTNAALVLAELKTRRRDRE